MCSAELPRWWSEVLAISTALTLFVLPSMYHVIEHWAEQRHGEVRCGP